MIARLIHGAIAQRFLVLLISAFLAAAGIWALRSTPIDALPDLSDVQVIIRTSYPGQAPQLVENQISYPIATSMMSVPGAKTVRAFSFYGDSFVYVIFEDGTDLYWARSRVLEYLSGVQAKLPAGAAASLGPDATGVGWIYEYALVDKTGAHDLGERCRIGFCVLSLRRCRTWRKLPALAAWLNSIKWCLTHSKWRRSGLRRLKSKPQCRRRIKSRAAAF